MIVLVSLIRIVRDLFVILSYLNHTVSYAARFAVVVFCNY